MSEPQPEEVLRDLGTATAGLLAGIGRLSDAGVRAASLLLGWTHGHVLAVLPGPLPDIH